MNDYSVPTRFAFQAVLMSGSIDEVVIVAGGSEIIARHGRIYGYYRLAGPSSTCSASMPAGPMCGSRARPVPTLDGCKIVPPSAEGAVLETPGGVWQSYRRRPAQDGSRPRRGDPALPHEPRTTPRSSCKAAAARPRARLLGAGRDAVTATCYVRSLMECKRADSRQSRARSGGSGDDAGRSGDDGDNTRPGNSRRSSPGSNSRRSIRAAGVRVAW
jgi:hypothetical protein